MPHRDSSSYEIELLMSFNCLNLFKPNEHTEEYYNRRPNDEKFPNEIEGTKHVYVGNKISFETTDKIVEKIQMVVLNDVKCSYAHGIENIHLLLYRKYIFIEEYEASTEKNEYDYLYKKDDELKRDNEGIIEHGTDFIIFKFIQDGDST